MGGLRQEQALRALPSVAELAEQLDGAPHDVAVRAARATVDEARREILRGAAIEATDLVDRARARVARTTRRTLRRVINATGVIVHTNLGRAPLAPAARDAVAEVAGGYSNLEYDLESGRRGSRQAHVEQLVCELTGAEAALAVNNGAAAVLLAAAALASGQEIVVSRGELIEIGGSFRIPDVVSQSGAQLVEVGTTNRTRLDDYRDALGEDTGAILRVHQSNFRSVGFVEDVGIRDLCTLGAPVIHDLGSGVLAAELPQLLDEPSARESLAAGAAVVCFSGDKLLGGPQAGVLAGSRDAIERCRSHPLARALRIDKLSLAALAETLRLYVTADSAVDGIPVLGMLAATAEALEERAHAIHAGLPPQVDAEVVEATARVGGGALPLLELSGPVCAVDPAPWTLDELAGRLRRGDPIVAARAHRGRLLFDPRTIDDAELDGLASALAAAFAPDR